jgi:uncharacterized membrane protein YhaH (DUF805 family)
MLGSISARAGADQATMQAAMFAQIEGSIRTQMWIGVVLGLIMTFLFSAAFVRRLHDSGKPGWILVLALVPYLGAMLYNIANMDRILDLTGRIMAAPGSAEAMSAQTQLYTVSLVGWIGYIVVIAFGVMKSDEGPNRYGEAPVRF